MVKPAHNAKKDGMKLNSIQKTTRRKFVFHVTIPNAKRVLTILMNAQAVKKKNILMVLSAKTVVNLPNPV